jgi:hypothetical protein
MLAEWVDIAYGNYTRGLDNDAQILALQQQAYTQLYDFNFCANCFYPLGNNDTVPIPNNTVALEAVVYKSYYDAVYYLIGIWALFRILVVVSLYTQDAKWKQAEGD